jgi:hypothetical protein
MRKIIIGMIFFIFSLNVVGQNSDNTELFTFRIFGRGFYRSIVLPNTWTIDFAFARENMVDGYFYLREYGINNSPALIVLNFYNGMNEDIIFEEWVEKDINYFSKFYDCLILDWNIINNNNYGIIIYSLQNDNEYLMYSASFDIGLNCFVNLWITIKDENKYNVIINDFRRCLENSSFIRLPDDLIIYK